MASLPVITVAITAYNEEKFIESAIQSVIDQQFDHPYEILIGDNCSQDNTQRVVEAYLSNRSNDVPIHYYRHEQNLGFIRNYNFLVNQAKGKYFCFAGGHDLWSDHFLTSLFQALESDPEAVLASPNTVWIDEEGNAMNRPTSNYDTSGLPMISRFAMSISGNQHALYGLFRTDALRKTRLQLEIFGSGAVLLGELAILGTFVAVPKAIWFRRVNRGVETRKQRLQRYNGMLFFKKRRRFLQHWKIPLAYISAIFRANISFGKKIQLSFCLPLVIATYLPLLLYDFKALLSSSK